MSNLIVHWGASVFGLYTPLYCPRAQEDLTLGLGLLLILMVELNVTNLKVKLRFALAPIEIFQVICESQKCQILLLYYRTEK